MTSVGIAYFWEKVASAGGLLLMTVLFSYLPFVIKRRVRSAGLIMSYCNCLAGGIVLGAMLMHMIPEMMEGACDSHSHDAAPAASAAKAHEHHDHNGQAHKRHAQKEAQAHAHGHEDHDHSHGFAWGPFSAGVSFLILFAVDRLFLTHSHCEDAHPAAAAAKKASDHEHGHGGCAHDHDHEQHHRDLSIQKDAEHGPCHEDDLVGGCHMDGINASSTKAQTFVFVLALSVHSFLEGLGVATKNKWGSFVSVLLSLYSHKWLEAFAVGAGVTKACFSGLHSFCLIAVYAVLTPAGILLGMWMDAASHSTSPFYHQLTDQVLDGLALGSFLFVSCIEMIPSEFHKQNKHSPFKFFVLCLGFAAMAAISLLHSH